MMNASNPSKRLRNNFLVCVAIFLLSVVFLRQYTLHYLPTSAESARLRHANATLGFSAIYVVSGRDSPRRSHLLEAAAVTELELTIPEQNEWTEDDITRFRIPDAEKSKVGKGSIKAWLSHHLVLRAFLASGHETALILEDDVDWDIRLRTEQIPIAQDAARSLLKVADAAAEQQPWGPSDDWDLLYIGHCGDYFGELADGVGVGYHHPEDLQRLPHVLVPDPTMPWRTDLHPFTASLLTAFRVPEQTRVFHLAQWPLCTFGYAINRRSAQRILDEIAPASEDPDRILIAYDAAIMVGCKEGQLRCYALQPELFHHMEGDSLIALEEKGERKIFRPPVDAAGLKQAKYRGETSNIGCGFWSGDFYADGDQNKLQYLMMEVGRKGQCLKDERPR